MPSQLPEEQIPKCMLQNVVPEEDAVVLWYLLHPLEDQLYHIVEVAEAIKEGEP